MYFYFIYFFTCPQAPTFWLRVLLLSFFPMSFFPEQITYLCIIIRSLQEGLLKFFSRNLTVWYHLKTFRNILFHYNFSIFIPHAVGKNIERLKTKRGSFQWEIEAYSYFSYPPTNSFTYLPMFCLQFAPPDVAPLLFTLIVSMFL